MRAGGGGGGVVACEELVAGIVAAESRVVLVGTRVSGDGVLSGAGGLEMHVRHTLKTCRGWFKEKKRKFVEGLPVLSRGAL